MIGSLFFAGSSWVWIAVPAGILLLVLGWVALRPGGLRPRTSLVGLGLRTCGILLLLVCLLEPRWAGQRAERGSNFLAVVADNSQGLQVTDAGASLTRGEQMQAALAGEDTEWLDRLGDEFQLRPYVFDRDLRRVRDFADLDFSGDRTALGNALRKIRERFEGRPLAGVILFTDGIATDLPEGLGDLDGLPPVYPVMVGSPGSVRDLRLDRVEVRQTAFDDAPVALRAEVGGSGVGGLQASVRVRALPAFRESPPSAEADPSAQRVRLRDDDRPIPASFSWRPTGMGVQFFEVSVHPEGGPIDEATTLNNQRVVMIDRGRPAYRILYVGGRPHWEYKFLNRALLEDPQLQMASMIRVAPREPKFDFKGRAGESNNPLFRGFGRSVDETVRYDQPVIIRLNMRDEAELSGGFPVRAEELFAYDAIILHAVEAGFFTREQLLLLRRFVAERGGGLLALGGADSLDHGGYADTPLAAALPLYLDRRPEIPPQGKLRWSLTREGWLEPWVRLRTIEREEEERLRGMPPFLVLNALPSLKPGATLLAAVEDELGNAFPALAAQRFGAGRTAVLAVGDLWRWGLQGQEQQADLASFWRQISRWLVADTPARVHLQVETAAADEPDRMRLRVTARDQEFRPLDLASARITIRRAGDGGTFSEVTLPAEPVPESPGEFSAYFVARDAGAYLAQVEVTDAAGAFVGRAQTGWATDPAADEFRSLEPNRPLLEELARRTGGEVIPWSRLHGLADTLPYRPAPITEAWSFPIWNQSWVFLLVLGCFLAEWAWRRWRGLP